MTRPSFQPLKLHGLVLDLAPEDVPPDRWTAGRNIVFRNGDTYRAEGINRVFESGRLYPVEALHYVDMGQQEWWYYVSGAGIGVTDGVGNHYDITPAGWGPIATKNYVWSIGDLNSLPFVNHPERGPYWHDGNPLADMQPLPDWPSGWSCRKMIAHKNFLLALAIDTGAGLAESQVSWSSSADPGQVPEFWNPSPTNDAGDITFSTPGGPVISGISLRDQCFIMKENATYAMQYVGGQWIFQSRDVFPTTGIFSPNAVIEHDNMIYMVTGRGEFIRHDGQSVQNILYGLAEQYLVRTINQEWPASVFMTLSDQSSIVAVAYPTGTAKACTEALGVEIASLSMDGPPDIAIRDLPGVYWSAFGFTEIVPQSWDGDPASWQSDTTIWNEQASGYRPGKIVLGGGANGFLEIGLGDDVLGVPIEAFAERTGLDMGDYGHHKVLSGAWPRLQGTAGQTVFYRFGGHEQVRSGVAWGAEMPCVIGTTQQLDFFTDGRFIAHAVRSTGGAAWKANGVEVLARRAGRW